MKVIILDGTHNKNGMTMCLINAFTKGVIATNPNAEVKQYDLLNGDIQFCKGCGSCTYDKDPVMGKCSINDGAEEIKKELSDCDVIVFATPIYEYAVSSVMKRFVERCLPLVTFKFGVVPRAKPFKGKHGVIICTSGAPTPINHLMGITWYPKFLLNLACRLFRCSRIDSIFAGGMVINNKIKSKWEEKSKTIGMNIARNYIKKFN